MTRGEDQHRFVVQPTAESYHRADAVQDPSQPSPRQVSDAYMKNFREDDSYYATYYEYNYEDSIFMSSTKVGKVGPCWKFVSPFTGLEYRGVLPFFYYEQDGKRYAWWMEIYNDYQAFRSFDQWDPQLDGIPRMDPSDPLKTTYGWTELVQAYVYWDQIPNGVRTILPKTVADSEVVGYKFAGMIVSPVMNERKSAWSHFVPEQFPHGVYTGNPRRAARHFEYGRLVERDNPDPIMTVELTPTEYNYTAWQPYVLPPKYPYPQLPPAGSYPRTSGYCKFGDWDMIYTPDEAPGRTASGGEFQQHIVNASYDTIQDIMSRSVNVSGALTRVSGQVNGLNVFEVYFNTRDMYQPKYWSFGKVISGDGGTPENPWSYQSKWLYETVDDQSLYKWSGNEWLNVPNPDRCFAGVCWDGTNDGKVHGTWLQNGRGIRAWASSEFYDRVVCKSFSTDPSTEFNGVLMLANSKVFECTGRHQCPFTWHSTLGYIAYHVAM